MASRFFLSVSLSLLAFAVGAADPLPRAKPESVGMSSERLGRIGEVLRADIEKGRLPGAFESSANAVNNFSNVFTYDLGLDYYSKYAAQVNAVTIEQTTAVARKYLVPEKMVVIAVGDKSKIEMPLKELGLGQLETWDAEGKPAK